MQLQFTGLLIGIAEIAVAPAGFSGVLAVHGNALFYREFAPIFAAPCGNHAGAAMQFSRLIRPAFQE